ncbi:MADS-box transcription factor 23-like [Primulina huaijiensis]|uniref:MADS-box transcription factor 23-like n=1 Tax=Primulina huaijiensis TaxID=1492673 RepID=UPI003CC75A07
MGKMKTTKIEDISARQVTFSKRRQGLFKKARELSILCEAEVACVVFSPAGRLHHYASSNIEDILHKFSLHSANKQHPVDSQDHADLSSGIQEKIKCLRMIISTQLHQWGVEELQRLETKLEAILKHVKSRKEELAMTELPVALDQTKDYGKEYTTSRNGPGDEETGCSRQNNLKL